MAAETGVTDNPYGIEALWTQSDYVGKGVFVILIVMSLWSWLVMINKWLDQRMLKKVAAEAEKSFWTAGSLQEGIGKLEGKVNPLRDIATDGLQAVEHHRKSAVRDVTSGIDVADYVASHIDRRTSMLQSSLALAASPGPGAHVRLSGFVEDDALADRYAAADAAVFLSEYEGFGLPALEAAARGVPLVVARAPSLGEIFRDAAVLVDPRDEGAVAAALDRVLSDGALRARLLGSGRDLAARHSWAETARRTRAALHEAAGR